jgi:CRP-like cAMP-binding protein
MTQLRAGTGQADPGYPTRPATAFLEALGPIEASYASRRHIRAGVDLYRQGETCAEAFILLEGWVFSSVLLENGSRLILDFAMPGSVIGYQPASTAVRSHSAQCLTSAIVSAVSRTPLDRLLMRKPDLALQLWELEACRVARANDHLVNVGRRDAHARVAHLLVELFYRATGRVPSVPGETLPVPLTLTHIADAIGLTNVHVSRMLRTLRRDGICAFRQRVLHIQDPNALLDLSEFGSDLEELGPPCPPTGRRQPH